MRRTIAVAVLSTFLAVPSAHAQKAAPAAPAVPETTGTAAAPEIDDPMLAPVPPAPLEIATWEEALRHVRARSTELRIAAEEVVSAEAKQRIALAGALPSVLGQASYTHNLLTKEVPAGIASVTGQSRSPTLDAATGQITLTQPLIALRAWHAIGTASVVRDAARLSFDDAKRQIALSVANTIVGVVTAERIAELNRVGLRNALVRLELTVRKTNLGGATGLDVVRARQDVEVARTTLVAGDESLRQAREALGLALGLPQQVGVPPTVDISGLEHDARTTCKPEASVDQRPDVAALHTQVEVANRGVADVKYQFAPTVNLSSVLASTTVDNGSAPQTTWNVGALLSVPIWEGGARYGSLRDAHAQEAIAEQKLTAGRRQALIQVEQARRGVTVAADRRRVAASARDLAVETDRLTRLAYQEGRGTSLELVSAAQSLREAETQLALREFEVVQARVLAVLALASCPW